MKKLKLRIDGMHCASCAGNIERSLGKVSGTKNIRANAIMGIAYLEIEDNVKEEDLKNAIKKVGYTLKSVESA